MHLIHTTPGFVIDSRPRGEAGKLVSIFTRDYGLVMAAAQGIRLEKSKLRYHVQEYSFGTFSLVRGKEYWRLTSAQETPDQKYKIKSNDDLIARAALLLKRLLHGEEPHPELFSIIESCARFLAENEAVSPEHLKTLESLIILRMLHALGYIGKDADVSEALESGPIDLRLLDSIAPKRTALNQHINKALRESHL
jgi:DNA repair protein RecO